MRVPTFILSSVLLVAALNDRHRQLSRSASEIQQEARATSYKLKDYYRGESFLTEWNFFSDDDPTHGLVDFQDQAQANASRLAYVQKDGTTVLAVDDTTQLPIGIPRKSVRISTKKTYNGGLFIADFWAMPHGCSVWPSYWTVGPTWPDAGEIDIIEGINKQTVNQYAAHSTVGCTLPDKLKVTTQQIGNQCATINGDNSGCRFLESDSRSYGHGFNMQGGGVFAHLWNSDGIKVWFFSRSEIPSDIKSKKPKPSTWGTPAAFWSNAQCDISKHFYDHTLVLDTTLCGEWAGPNYAGSGCSGTCEQAVTNPDNFKYAKWMINYIAVYD